MLRIALLGSLLLLGACQSQDTTTYDTRGRVVAVYPATNTVRILHEDIPEYMQSMEMDFIPRDLEVLDRVVAGDLVSFTIYVAEDGSVAIDDVEKLPDGTPLTLAEPMPEPVVPDSLAADSLGVLGDSTLVLEDSVAVQ